MRPASPRTALVVLIAAVAAVKMFLQATIPGFLQGDDVETLEAAFRAAFGLAYDDWEIRSHLLPELIVAPLLRLAAQVPGIGTDGLLLAASLPFIVASAMATLLLFRLARQWGLPEEDAVIAAVLYGVHAIPVVYGIGGFPRPLATPLLLGAALLATREKTPPLAAAGLLVGIAGAARYSEWIFLLPLLAMILMAPGRRFARASAALAGFLAGMTAVGLYDALSGEGAFSSLVEFARYTLAGGSSSAEAAQPFWWYLARLHQWLPLTALPLLVWGWRSSRRNAVIWIAVPLIAFSLVHHKELRYLQNVIPFLAIAVAAGVGTCRGGLRPPGPQVLQDVDSGRPQGAPTDASGVLPFVLLALTVLWGAWGVNRLDKRSSSAVAAARAIAESGPRAVAVEQAWAYGDHLYFPETAVTDLPVDPSPADLGRAAGAQFVSLYASHATRQRRAELGQLGFAPWRDFSEGGRPVVVFRRALPPG